MQLMNDPVVIVGAKRTPIGGLNGQFVSLSSPQLAAVAIKAAVAESGLKLEDINEAIIGCVLPAALGQAPARQAVLGAGLLKSTACSTLNKVCGSGMKAVMLANDQIAPVPVKGKGGDVVIDTDETPGQCKIEKIPTLRPAFKADGGTVTAAGSASISDGAAMLVLMRESDAKARGIKPLARIVGHA